MPYADSSSVLRYKMDYEITSENKNSGYVLKGGIMLNNISDPDDIFGGGLYKELTKSVSGYVCIESGD